MGKGFYVSKAVALFLLVTAVAALATIIALSVVYSQERAKTLEDPASTSTARPSTTTESTPSTPKEPWHLYRLPDSLSPSTYNVSLHPRLTPNEDSGLYIFTGQSSVEFTCLKETDLILIHSNKLNLTLFDGFHAKLTGLNGAVAPTMKNTFLEVPTQYLVIQLNAPLKAGSTYRLDTEFVGELADDLGGFYRSEYVEDGVKKVVATTQMQPTDARKAFPCFDEPAMKAVFHMTLIHPVGTVALSNGMNYGKFSSPTHPGAQTMTIWFGICCPLHCFSSLQIRIWAREKAIKEGQGDYALNKTGPILAFLENYYNSTYPLSKSDQIALPDFGAGAMENWGLITYRETSLLYDPAVSSNGDLEWVATVISHELAHMWFGNLVTMKWWNDLWLNEGFATYVSYLGADLAEPDWNMKDLIVLNEITGVMGVDALASSHPLSSKEEDIQRPEQIGELFDAITYSKGAAVLRMLSHFITEEVFSEGLHTYLDEFQYNTTGYRDLWNHLQMAVDKNGVSLPGTLEDVMNRWILQMGFPVVTINTASGEISQNHFLLNPDSVVDRPSEFDYQWFVHVTWIKNGGAEQKYWLTEKQDVILGTNDWLVANIDMEGFYRVNYDLPNWERLIKKLDSTPQVKLSQLIPSTHEHTHRHTNMCESFSRARIIDTTLALRTTKFLNKEVEYMPWETATRNLDFFYLMFDRSEVYGPMQAYIRKQVEPLFDYFKNLTLNWTQIPKRHTDQYNQVNAISMACSTGVEGCKELVTGWFKEWMDNPTNNNISHPSLSYESPSLCGQKEWDFAWTMFQTTTVASEAEKLRRALACTTQPWLLNRYLQYCLDPNKIRKQDASSTIVAIANSPIGQPLAWDFIRANWDRISNYGAGAFSFGSLINGVSKRFYSEFDYKQLRQFKEDNEAQLDWVATSVDQALEKTRANINWVEKNKEDILKWFEAEASSPA
uniref:Aminopeptidase n=1 Tax=Salarias fasciatus TaxID=181472 RepID=A0A672FXS4_SALFA